MSGGEVLQLITVQERDYTHCRVEFVQFEFVNVYIHIHKTRRPQMNKM